jgi:hypothetical protein
MKTKILFFAAMLFLAGSFAASAQSQQSALDGKRYKIDFMKDGKTESIETLIFTSSMLQTPDCAKYGFNEGKAFVKSTKDYFTWASTINSDTEGVMAWQGSVKGDKIEGSCVWRKTGQASINYTFTGTIVKE